MFHRRTPAGSPSATDQEGISHAPSDIGKDTTVEQMMEQRIGDYDALVAFAHQTFAETERWLDDLEPDALGEVLFGGMFPPNAENAYVHRVVRDDQILRVDGVECWIYQHGIRHLGELEHARALVGLGPALITGRSCRGAEHANHHPGLGEPDARPNRAGPSTLVTAAGTPLLVDCGRGAIMRLAGAGAAAPALGAVLITHLHSDHITDLNDVITTRWVTSFAPNPLRVVGPEGTQRLVDRTLSMLEDDIGYRLAHHDDLNEPPEVQVTEISDGPIDIGIEGLTLSAAPTEHAPVRPTVGYRFEADGAVAAVVGDTIPCEGLDRLVDGADVYVQTTVRRDQIEAIGVPRLVDVLDYQSTVEQAADTAARHRVRTLV